MKETVFKVEVDDELVDMLQIRVQDMNEIEIFVLTQALGLLELLIHRVILTSQCKKSVLSGGTKMALMELQASEEVISVISRSARMQGTVLEVTDEVVEQAKELKEETIKLLAERLKGEQLKKKEWVEMFDFDVKTLRKMHDEAMAKRQKELEEKIRLKEMWNSL
ncbi:MAG: hypothetical protein IJB07_03520 [Firmicutes bacterium]|nr:hypothetical protein [Bacillota bacterium]